MNNKAISSVIGTLLITQQSNKLILLKTLNNYYADKYSTIYKKILAHKEQGQ